MASPDAKLARGAQRVFDLDAELVLGFFGALFMGFAAWFLRHQLKG